MVLPVAVLMLARMTVSVRVPMRFLSASPPSSRMFSRGLSAHGSSGVGSLGSLDKAVSVGRVALLDSFSLLNTVPTRLACS